VERLPIGGIHFHQIVDDETLIEYLRKASKEETLLFEAPKETTPDYRPTDALEPAFKAWLRGLAPDFHKMDPMKKRQLLDTYNRERADLLKPSRRDQMQRAFVVRYGTDWFSRLSQIERMAWSEVSGNRAEVSLNSSYSQHKRSLVNR
jgi:hypothetical protein